MHVLVIETPPLGDRSYLIHDGQSALVIDPQRDVDRIEAVAAAAGVRITHVAETHIHNDYLTGGVTLAQRHDAAYLVNADDDVSYERVPITSGETVKVGRLEVEVLATPGHTDTHLAYVVHDGDERAVFSGGSLLFGSVGRTDLLGRDRAAELAAAQHASVRRLAERAGADAALYPTHGFGSFCSAGPAGERTSSTIGAELIKNHALIDDDVEHFVAELLAGLTAYPTYYAHMGPANLVGPPPADLSLPDPLTGDDLRARLAAGEWVVDLRNRVAFAAGHLDGSTSFEYGDGERFTSYLGWVIPYGAAITLVGGRDDVEQAIRDLSRIGFDQPEVAFGDRPGDIAPGVPTRAYERLAWPEVLAIRTEHDLVVDVRRTDEYATSHIAGALNIPLHDLLARHSELPRDRRLLVHCAAGYRASVAASLLDRIGFEVVHVDDDFDNAAPAGIPLTA